MKSYNELHENLTESLSDIWLDRGEYIDIRKREPLVILDGDFTSKDLERIIEAMNQLKEYKLKEENKQWTKNAQ